MTILDDINNFSKFLSKLNTNFDQKLISFNDCYEQLILKKDEFIHSIQEFEHNRDIQNTQEFKNQVRSEFNKMILPYFHQGTNIKHVYDKPYGFVGDYKTITFICNKFDILSEMNFGNVFDLVFYTCKAAMQHRNKMEWLSSEYKSASENARILDFACGPAFDLQHFYNLQPNFKGEFVCLDIQQEALEHVQKSVAKFNWMKQISFFQENIHSFLKRSIEDNIRKYGYFDVISTCGVMDYLPDKYAVFYLKLLWSMLLPNGKLMFANLHPDNPDKTFMEWFGEWKVIYRTEEDMIKLIKEANIPSEDVQLQRDESGICILVTAHANEKHNINQILVMEI